MIHVLMSLVNVLRPGFLTASFYTVVVSLAFSALSCDKVISLVRLRLMIDRD